MKKNLEVGKLRGPIKEKDLTCTIQTVQFIIASATCNVDVDTLCSVYVDAKCVHFQLQIMFL